MQDVMTDLETLGQGPGCVILSIGAVAFDPVLGVAEQGFYQVIDTKSCLDAGLIIDEATQQWWDEQSPEAKQVLDNANNALLALPLSSALKRFNEYVSAHGAENVKVWGNGAAFDNAILSYAYKAAGVEPAWKFWNDRCYRTVKAMVPQIKLARQGTHHNALDDAVSQAHHVCQVLNSMVALHRVSH